MGKEVNELNCPHCKKDTFFPYRVDLGRMIVYLCVSCGHESTLDIFAEEEEKAKSRLSKER